MEFSRTFFEEPDKGSMGSVEVQSGTIPPPPSDGGVTPVNVRELYHSNFKLTQQVNDLNANIAKMQAEHAAKLNENIEKISSYDKLKAEHEAATGALERYKAHVGKGLKSQIESLDEALKGDFADADFSADPLAGLMAVSKEMERFKALEDRLKNKQAQETDPTTGAPVKPESGGKVISFGSQADVARFMKEATK